MRVRSNKGHSGIDKAKIEEARDALQRAVDKLASQQEQLAIRQEMLVANRSILDRVNEHATKKWPLVTRRKLRQLLAEDENGSG